MTSLRTAPRGADVHLWPIDIGRCTSDDEALLDDIEKARADRFVKEADRTRFVAAHAAKRRILSAYVGVPPSQCSFVVQKGGKPELSNDPSLQFSLTHAGNRAVMAVASTAAVGVDLELPRTLNDIDALAGEVATQAEVESLRALPPAAREGAFLCLWTRKEAALKACGTGLAGLPKELDVGCGDEETLTICRQIGRAIAVRSVPINGAIAAVARLDALGAIVFRSGTGA
jgi:4'-phosphopantetheinyl transferase